jgi:hypothetical protein
MSPEVRNTVNVGQEMLPYEVKGRFVHMFHFLNYLLLLLLLSLAPQASLGLGLLHKTRLNFLEASQQFPFFYRVGLLAPRPTPIPEDQASVFVSPRGRVATHFSRLSRRSTVNTVRKCFHKTLKEGLYIIRLISSTIYFD